MHYTDMTMCHGEKKLQKKREEKGEEKGDMPGEEGGKKKRREDSYVIKERKKLGVSLRVG